MIQVELPSEARQVPVQVQVQAQVYDWQNDVVTSGLIRGLQRHSGGHTQAVTPPLESRDFLAPIYKWTKHGNKLYNTDKAFAFTEWLIQLQSMGDASLGIEAQPHLEPKYAVNVLINMSQRANQPENALRAFELLKAHSRTMQPDVFTLTALVDVVGRSSLQGMRRAFQLYQDEMLSQRRCLPNVVTYVTLMRLVAHMLPPDSVDLIRMLLDDAHRLVRTSTCTGNLHDESMVSPVVHLGGNPSRGSIDNSIYNAALAACHKLKDFRLTADILHTMNMVEARVSVVTRKILAKIVHVCFNDNISSTVNLLETLTRHLHLLSNSDIEVKAIVGFLEDKFKDMPDITTEAVHTPESSYAGCLGSDASDSLRRSVIEHDVQKLVERLHFQSSTGTAIVEADFATLVHQCRKRKWAAEVGYLLTFVKDLAINGAPDLSLPPQPQLGPSLHGLYEAALEAYFACGDVTNAVALFDDIATHTRLLIRRQQCIAGRTDDDDSTKAVEDDLSAFTVLCCRGFVSNARIDLALHVYWTMRARDFVPPRRLILGLMRGGGYVAREAILVLGDVLQLVMKDQRHNAEDKSPTEGLSLECVTQGMVFLIESIGVLCPQDGIERLKALWQQLLRYDDTDSARLCDLLQQQIFGDEDCDCMFALTLVLVAACSYASVLTTQALLGEFLQLGWIHLKYANAIELFISDALVSSSLGSSSGPSSVHIAKRALKEPDSLPFNSFSYFQAHGPLKVIDARRDVFKKIMQAIRQSSDTVQTRSSVPYLFTLLPIIAASDEENARLTTDPTLQAYMVHGTPLRYTLMMYYVHIRMLLVRTKDSRHAVEVSIQQAVENTTLDVSADMWMAQIWTSLAPLDAIISGKTQGRIAKMFVDSINTRSSYGIASPDNRMPLSIAALETMLTTLPSLELTKLLFKPPFLLSALSDPVAFGAIGAYIGRYVDAQQERLFKVVQFIKQHDLIDYVDLEVLEAHLMRDVTTAIEGSTNNGESTDQHVSPDHSQHQVGAAWACVGAYLACFPTVPETKDGIRSDLRAAICRIIGTLTTSIPRNAIILEYAKKMLVRFDLLMLPEFQHLSRGVGNDSLVDPWSENVPHIDPKCHPLCLEDLSFDRQNIHIVATAEQLTTARLVLTAPGVDKIGLDVEWRPFSTGALPTKCSIFQIACKNYVFLFDLLALQAVQPARDQFHDLLEHLICDASVLKVGFSINDDFRRLRESYGSNRCYMFGDIVKSYVDVSKLEAGRSLSLSKICERYLGRPLDKRFQCSDWERRPLLEEQIVYSALDALCLLHLIDHFHEAAIPFLK